MGPAAGTKSSGATQSGHLLRKVGTIGAASAAVGGSAFALLAAMASPASASTFTVDKSTDDGSGTVPGSLSWAIEQAEANSGADTITFAPSLSSVTMSGSLRPRKIHKSLDIQGPGAASLTIDLNGHAGLYAYLDPGATFSLSGVTITGGAATAGGALLITNLYAPGGATASVTITGTTFSKNDSTGKGGAVLIDGWNSNTTVSDTTFYDNSSTKGGGALDISGGVLVTGSVFDHNTAGESGGGLYMENGNITVVDSTFSNNTATGGGGATFDFVTAVVRNSTFSGNSADLGGGIQATGSLSVIQSTITGNTATASGPYGGGGGLWLRQSNRGTPRDTLSMVLSTVSGNTATSTVANELRIIRCCGAQGSSIVGSIIAGTASGSSIGGTGATTGFPLDVSDSIIGATDNAGLVDGGGNQLGVADPKLGGLADNGGPTKTMSLLAGSPALDAGPATVPTFPDNTYDQRGTGFDRVRGNKVDVGAFEDQSAPEPTTTTSTTAPATTTTTSATSTTTAAPSTSTTIDAPPNQPTPPVAGGSGLPSTGRDLALPIALGGGLLLTGAVGVFASRRSREAAHRSND